MVGAVLWVFDGVARTLSTGTFRFFVSRAARAHNTAFCWRLRIWRRCTVPLLKTAAVMRAMWAMVARGAFSTVIWASDALRMPWQVGLAGLRATGGEERFMFS